MRNASAHHIRRQLVLESWELWPVASPSLLFVDCDPIIRSHGAEGRSLSTLRAAGLLRAYKLRISFDSRMGGRRSSARWTIMARYLRKSRTLMIPGPGSWDIVIDCTRSLSKHLKVLLAP